MKTKGIVFLSLFAVLSLITLPSGTGPISPPRRMPAGDMTVEAVAAPLHFVANAGQADARTVFYADARGYTLWLTRQGLVFDWVEKDGKGEPVRSVAELRFEGVNEDFDIVAADPSDYRVSYFFGRDESEWKTDIPTSRAVLYKNVYEGIDLKVYGTNRQVEYDWVVAPGANPDRIRFCYAGGREAGLDGEGNLVVGSPAGRILHRTPRAYQVIAGRRVDVAVAFKKMKGGSCGFALGAYDPGHPLAIDPLVLAFSTYLGGIDSDGSYKVAVDPEGAVYVTGLTRSRNFPPVTQKWPREDFYVTKISADGRSLIYTAFFPGSHEGILLGLAVDRKGFAYLAASTKSAHFPLKNAFQTEYKGGGSDAVILKLARSGKSLVYSSYLGGSGGDTSAGLAIDAAGAAILAGRTRSPDFPTKRALQTKLAGGADVFIAKVAADGSGLVSSTFLGGPKNDDCNGLALCADGAVVVAGNTSGPGFPLASAFQKVFGGGYQDAFVAKLSPKGDKLVFSSYYGGTSYDYAQDVAVDAAGAVYIAGSTQGTVPVKNPFQKKRSASYEAVVVKIAPDGKSVVYASYLGGSGEDRAYGIAVDSSGNAYVVGWTGSRNFPLKSPGSAELGGSQDGFLTVVEADGAKVRLSTFVGGNYRERVWGVALDEDGGIYLCGYTNSTDFPVKAAYQAEPGGDNDAFVLKIKPLGAARPR